MVKKITRVGNNLTFEDDVQTVKRELDEIVKGSFSAHNTRHENGGGDEISIADLSGEPADTVNKTGAQTIAGKKIFDEGAIVHAPKTYTPTPAGTVNIDLALGNNHEIQMPAGNITIEISNETVGQYFTIDITQDGGGSRIVTMFITIKWAFGGTPPTLSTGGNQRDSLGFKVTGADTYDGFIIGQDI